ncbi:sensor domain-containing diguanylate cyclase [Pseudohongiella spirulinae]|uniref:diguanylate cyclase n=1 Tax=Pseudohongiella spirulinae TaxID=1249552 RepID=A0A0S2KCA1_9GAMM|nr:diguanylate cyclase [Pseudohongiella spirulinae]ALO45949.1 Putative diguanylate cyclase [Pseudohongiella spirulinae]
MPQRYICPTRLSSECSLRFSRYIIDFVQNKSLHTTPRPRSLMRSVLRRIVLAAVLVVGGLTALAYSFIHTETQSRLLDNLSDWVIERARNDSLIFELAQENLARFSAEFLRLYTSDVPVHGDIFWSYYQEDEHGAVRLRRDFYDGIYADDGLYYSSVSSFVGNNQSVDSVDLQRRLVLSVRLLAQLGPAMINRFQNIHVSFPENAIALYAPGTPWGLEAEPDLPMNELGVIRSMQQSENPERLPGWSGLYYDETAQEWALTYQVPLDMNGQHLINPSHDVSLTDLMERLITDTPEGGYNLIFRQDGYLIAHPAEPASDRRWVGQMSLQNIDDPALVRLFELIDESTGGEPGEVALIHNSIDDNWLAVSELSGPGWWFVSVYPAALIRESASQAAAAVLISGVILLLLLIFIIGFIIRRDAEKPLEQLREAAESIALGDYDAVAQEQIKLPRHLRNEIGLLARTFYGMAVNIRGAQTTLEQVVAERTRALETANHNLRELSLLDGLLGIHNRRAFDRDLASVYEQCKRGVGDFYVMMIDVDSFKLFNDSYGHGEGDLALKEIAATLNSAIRSDDRLYRYGGEEFVVIFNSGLEEPIESAAERLLNAVRNLAIPFPESGYGIVTVSAGLVRGCADYPSSEQIVAHADRLLYESKRGGRNRLSIETQTAS